MTAPITALGGARHDGLARIEEVGLHGMITLRGDLASKAVKAAVMAATGAKLPGQRGVVRGKSGTAIWMSPDELLLCPYAEVDATLGKVTAALGTAHALAVDVSDARAMLTVSGPAAREVLAKLCPVDFAPGAFGPGMVRRTRMAQVPAAIWMEQDESFRVICFRSVARYVFDLLGVAAQPGSGVGVY
ncbi:MAG: sarcosine oxidase subunit gamma family protein [Antarcticimicrobium sp.]|uniref:sarcosine oxidase subunit gamma n=1 Tax=Antarcticimicrobium sp. TaxID=2824147 RepID=UPI002623A7AA|nr:sarcosine oxidase subunit gamma family protein [Antarcticimicrobium sp.]MDF1718133.1 sarcosine oxidase subunit gamma family protein [Antarcticimicrobium sp.]